MHAMGHVAQRMTADEYLEIPWDGQRTQLIEGEIVVNEARKLHQVVLLDLLRALDSWASAAPDRGSISLPLDVKLDERNVVGPDLMWYADGREPDVHAERPYALPDLAVEVRSPSTWRYDIGAKKAAYERAGLKELWLVDTVADAVLVFRRSAPTSMSFDHTLELAGEDQLASPLLPGFALAIKTLLA